MKVFHPEMISVEDIKSVADLLEPCPLSHGANELHLSRARKLHAQSAQQGRLPCFSALNNFSGLSHAPIPTREIPAVGLKSVKSEHDAQLRFQQLQESQNIRGTEVDVRFSRLQGFPSCGDFYVKNDVEREAGEYLQMNNGNVCAEAATKVKSEASFIPVFSFDGNNWRQTRRTNLCENRKEGRNSQCSMESMDSLNSATSYETYAPLQDAVFHDNNGVQNFANFEIRGDQNIYQTHLATPSQSLQTSTIINRRKESLNQVDQTRSYLSNVCLNYSESFDNSAETRREISEKFLRLVKSSCENENLEARAKSFETSGQDLSQMTPLTTLGELAENETRVKKKITIGNKEVKEVYECSFKGCKRQFTWLWALKEHEKRHKQGAKSRDFKCTVCSKAFFTKSCLKSHMKIHTRKPHSYKCKYEGCPKTYSTSEGLRLHIRNHHQVDKRWVCPVEDCGKKFVRQSDMRLHIMRIHAKTRPHPCRFEGCSKSFACFSELRRHEMSHIRKQKKNDALQKKRKQKLSAN